MGEEEMAKRISELEQEVRRITARRPSRWLAVLIPVVFAIVLLTGGSVSKPNTFSSGDPISSSQVNANFDTLYGLVNGNIDSANLADDAGSLLKVSGGIVSASGGNIGIGTATPSSKLEVAGSVTMSGFSLPSGSASGRVLTSDAGGTGTWQSPLAGPWAGPTDGNIYYMGGRVGVGTASPLSSLHVVATTAPQVRVENSGGDAQIILDSQRSYMTFYNSGTPVLHLGGDDFNYFIGRVAVGTSVLPSQKLYVAGDIYATGPVTSGSSRVYKEHIRDLEADAALAAFEKLVPVRFNYKESADEENMGFVAEDVPDLLATKDRKGATAMDFVAVLVKVVQEQQKRIERLERMITTQGTEPEKSGAGSAD